MHFCEQPEPSHASAQPTSCISARNLPPLTFARNQLPAFLRAGCPAHRARSLPPEFLCTACPRTFARSLPPAFLRAVSPLTRLRAACLLHSCVQPISCISARGLHRARLRAAYLLHFGAQQASNTFAHSLPPAFLRASCPSHRNFIYLLTYELFVFARKSNKSKKLE